MASYLEELHDSRTSGLASSFSLATSAADIPIETPSATLNPCHANSSAFWSAICLHLMRRLNASVAVGGVCAPACPDAISSNATISDLCIRCPHLGPRDTAA